MTREVARPRQRNLVWFPIPGLVLYAFVVVVPSTQGALYAFTDWDGVSSAFSYVGLENLFAVVEDEAARGAVGNTLLVAVATTVVQNIVGLLLALGVHTRIRSRNVLRVLLFAPAIMTPVVTAYLWKYLLAPDGSLNALLGGLGLTALRQNWLGDPALAIWTVVLVMVWQFSGYSMVIYLAGLQGVPAELLEASALDGAGAMQRLRYVVLPLLAPATTVSVMLSLITGFKAFDQIFVMTGGGPGHASDTLSTLIYKDAFQLGNFGYAIALALVLTAFVAVISAGQFGALRRQEDRAR